MFSIRVLGHLKHPCFSSSHFQGRPFPFFVLKVISSIRVLGHLMHPCFGPSEAPVFWAISSIRVSGHLISTVGRVRASCFGSSQASVFWAISSIRVAHFLSVQGALAAHRNRPSRGAPDGTPTGASERGNFGPEGNYLAHPLGTKEAHALSSR